MNELREGGSVTVAYGRCLCLVDFRTFKKKRKEKKIGTNARFIHLYLLLNGCFSCLVTKNQLQLFMACP